MKIGIITLFPEMFDALNHGIVSRAVTKGHLELYPFNPRDFATDLHRTVDDRPYGGGPGMLMMAGPLVKAIQAAKSRLGLQTRVLYLSPQGRSLTQAGVMTLAKEDSLLLLAGRYEGIDERVTELVDEEWSIGDYVLTGGELPAMVLIDAVVRMIPGVLGHHDSASQDSFMNGLLDCPHYTRPEVFEGKEVPKVLLAGNHQAIAAWRLKQALGRTWLRRPDLLKNRILTSTEEILLNEFIREHQESRGKNT